MACVRPAQEQGHDDGRRESGLYRAVGLARTRGQTTILGREVPCPVAARSALEALRCGRARHQIRGLVEKVYDHDLPGGRSMPVALVIIVVIVVLLLGAFLIDRKQRRRSGGKVNTTSTASSGSRKR